VAVGAHPVLLVGVGFKERRLVGRLGVVVVFGGGVGVVGDKRHGSVCRVLSCRVSLVAEVVPGTAGWFRSAMYVWFGGFLRWGCVDLRFDQSSRWKSFLRPPGAISGSL